MRSTHSFILLLFPLLFLSSCKSSKTADKEQLKPLPARFEGNSDSSSAGSMPWNYFFQEAELASLIDEGLKSNLDAAIALQRLEAAYADLRLAKGELFPAVNASAAYWQRKFGYYTMDDAGNRTTEMRPGEIIPAHLPDYFVGLQTSWEIDIWGKLRNRKKAAFNRYLSGVEGKNLVLTNLVAELASSYYTLLALDNKLEVIRETIALQEQALEMINVQKQVAAVNELAVQQFSAQLLHAKALEFETLQQITETENRMNLLLGRFPQAIVRTKNTFNQQPAFKTGPGAPALLLSNRPDIRQAEYELLAAKADVKAAKAAFYPSLSIVGSYGFQSYKPDLLFLRPQSIAYSLLGNLAAPLVNRSAIKATFHSANARQLEGLFNYQKSILNGYMEVSGELSRLRNLERMNSLKTQEVEALSKAAETSNALFRTSRANYLEVLMARKSLLDAQLQLLDMRLSQYHAAINLYKALGGGWR